MGTRCITKFCEGGEPVCAVYRHWDGNPEIAMADLVRFLVELEIKVPLGPMSRPALDEPRLLAARYIVYLAELFAEGWEELPMNFTGVEFVEADQKCFYEYHVHCDRTGYLSRNIPDIRAYEQGVPMFENIGKYRAQAFNELDLTDCETRLTAM